MNGRSVAATTAGISAAVRARCVLFSCVLAAACGGSRARDQPLGAAGSAGAAATAGASAGVPAADDGGRSAAAGGGAAGAAAAGGAGRPTDSGKAGSGGAAGGPVAVAGSGGGAGAPAAGSGGVPAAGSGGGGANVASLPPVTSTSGPGPFEAMQDLRSGPKGQSGVFRPRELGKDGIVHPLFVWGCGGGSTPSTYAELMTQVATHGFVVIAETSAVSDGGAPLKAAIDWLIAENERADGPFYKKLDTSKIGLGGHSIGSANSFLVGPDPRLTTTLHVAGGSLDMAGDINAATTGKGGKGLVHPVAYICSEMDQFGNVEKTELDYMNTTAPAWMTVMSGVDHVAAARQGMPAIIAWLRWQLAGETQRRGAFLDPMGEFNSGKYVSKSKNW